MDLPRKDKNGNSYVSYSQLSLFKRDKKAYYDSYILGVPFDGNEYTDFGSKVGEALEKNDFSKFSKTEQKTLKKVTRLDLFEKMTILNYDGFYVLGFIDTCSDDFKTIIDYKTGGKNKEFNYCFPDYTQLHLYALSIRQETGIYVDSASVEFIRRKGNLYKGEELIVGEELPIIIDVDISENNLKKVYWDTLKTAKEIENFYKQNK